MAQERGQVVANKSWTPAREHFLFSLRLLMRNVCIKARRGAPHTLTLHVYWLLVFHRGGYN